MPEGERLQPHIPWPTTDAALVSEKGYPSEFRVRASQLKHCEMLQRPGLGMTNHLDWFISTIWRVLDQAHLAEETKAELDGLLTSSLVSVNQTEHVIARPLAYNATTRRKGNLDSFVLDSASELVLRGQPIGEPICWEAVAPRSFNEPLKRRRSPCSFRRPWDARDSPEGLGCREGRIRPTDDPAPVRSRGRAKRPLTSGGA